jgi:hypothetical protein
MPAKIAEYALAAGVPADQIANVVGAVASANGAPVSIPGLTDAQIAAAQLGRLWGFSKAYSYVYWTILVGLRPSKELRRAHYRTAFLHSWPHYHALHQTRQGSNGLGHRQASRG